MFSNKANFPATESRDTLNTCCNLQNALSTSKLSIQSWGLTTNLSMRISTFELRSRIAF